MAVLTWLRFVFLLRISLCYENLARRGTTIITQSSTYNSHYANRTNDGNIMQSENDCAHTDINQSGVAWLQVDLKEEYSIKTVKIFYRDEIKWVPHRFRYFYLDVSNSSATERPTEKRIRCHTDNTTKPAIPPSILTMPCNQIARYVIVETMYDTPKDTPTIGPILEICEIEVNGCSKNCVNGICNDSGYCNYGCYKGNWGQTCDSTCPVNCHGQTCNQITEHCNICDTGFWGDKCTTPCSVHCSGGVCEKNNGRCTQNCSEGVYGDVCDKNCSRNCVAKKCDRQSGVCLGGCAGNWKGDRCDECSRFCKENACDTSGYCTKGCFQGRWGHNCESFCSPRCSNRTCDSTYGHCTQGCYVGSWGQTCNSTCPVNCHGQACNQITEHCNICDTGFWGDKCTTPCSVHCSGGVCEKNNGRCTQNCSEGVYGDVCDKNCSRNCVAKKCDRQSGVCLGGCAGNWKGGRCDDPKKQYRSEDNFPMTEVGAGVGALLFMIVVVTIVIVVLLRKRRDKESSSASSVLYHKTAFDPGESKGYTNLGSINLAIEDPDEEPQIEKPEECVYYNNLFVAKDIPVSDLVNIITTKQTKENEGFLKEFKSLPYGERFPCEVAKSAENIPKNRFKTTFPYDHSRVVLELSKEFNSDYINANYIENMDGKREFIASQGPRANTVVDHWRMIWQEHVNYIVMLTNLIEGPKVKCQQYWPEVVGKEMDVEPFSLTLLEEKVYAYFVVRKMAVRKKKVTGSRTVVQFHYTRWPDHGTPDPLNLVDFLRQFRHKIKPSHYPIIVHCSAGIGRTGTFIALDVLSRYGKVKGKLNVIEYVKAMRKDRMTMIQNVDQYVFLYNALCEFFRRSGHFVRKDDFLSEFVNLNKAETKKQLSDEFNELTSLKTKYEAKDYKSGKKHQKLNASKSVLPVEKYLVYLTSHIAGRETYYNAVNVSSFTQAEELLSAQFPVTGAAIDLVRLLIDEDCSFLVSLNSMSEVKELKDWVNDKIEVIKLDPYEITKHAQTELSPDIRKTNLKIKGKEDDILSVEVLECLSWSSSQTVPKDKSILINFIKQFCLDRKSHPNGRVAVLSKDGASCCGVFCAVYNAVQQIQQDDEVDMFTIIRQLQVRRPEMISTVEEYELSYDAVHQFLASDSVYANT